VLPCRTVASELDPDMWFHLGNSTIEIVRWGLACPLREGFLLGRVEEMNKVLEGEERDSLRGFVFAQLSPNKGSEIRLGATLKNTAKDSLFWHYQQFCRSHGYAEPSERSFGDKIMSLWLGSGLPVTRRRTSVGTLVKGVKVDPTCLIERRLGAAELAEIRGWDPFTLANLVDTRTQAVSEEAVTTEGEDSDDVTKF